MNQALNQAVIYNIDSLEKGIWVPHNNLTNAFLVKQSICKLDAAFITKKIVNQEFSSLTSTLLERRELYTNRLIDEQKRKTLFQAMLSNHFLWLCFSCLPNKILEIFFSTFSFPFRHQHSVRFHSRPENIICFSVDSGGNKALLISLFYFLETQSKHAVSDSSVQTLLYKTSERDSWILSHHGEMEWFQEQHKPIH